MDQIVAMMVERLGILGVTLAALGFSFHVRTKLEIRRPATSNCRTVTQLLITLIIFSISEYIFMVFGDSLDNVRYHTQSQPTKQLYIQK